MNDLLKNIDRIHITPMGEKRIQNNIILKNDSVLDWSKNKIKNADLIMQMGKNWYLYNCGVVITINASSFTIITAHKICGRVRRMKEADYCCLEEFLYQSIFIKEGEALPPREIIHIPEIYVYIKDFGKQKGDFGVVAEQNGQVIGAAWTRIISGYGHINNDTPELVIALLHVFRNCGIGTKLIKKLFIMLKNNGYKQTSLSVQKDNPAVKLYQRLGYKIIADKMDSANNEDYIMLKNL